MLRIWLYWPDYGQPLQIKGQTLAIADGDSFAVGSRKLRLDGIDAPEYHQTCSDAAGRVWECGKASRASLEQFFLEPGLTCTAGATDKYARSIAKCSNVGRADISAAQVNAGMAISDEYFAVRSYGEEEDAARAARRGLWTGEFIRPDEWRAANKR